MKHEKLKNDYERCCNEYAKIFAKKQGLDFDFWVGDSIGGIACFSNDYFFNISDIVEDINNDVAKRLAIDWHNDTVENHPEYINFHSYHKGLRYSDLKQ